MPIPACSEVVDSPATLRDTSGPSRAHRRLIRALAAAVQNHQFSPVGTSLHTSLGVVNSRPFDLLCLAVRSAAPVFGFRLISAHKNTRFHMCAAEESAFARWLIPASETQRVQLCL